MEQSRPDFRLYRAHIYRQYFGRSLSVKPITGKSGEYYAILKSTSYKLFWLITVISAFALTIMSGVQFGYIPLLAVLGLYIIVAVIRYFFASFVNLGESGLISYEMCNEASKRDRPNFGAYLVYIFIPTRTHFKHLIKNADGREYYQLPQKYYPISGFFGSLGYPISIIGLRMGFGLFLFVWLAIGVLYLLLSPLSLYFLRFKSTEDEQDYDFLHDDESSTTLYKIGSGILIAGGLAAFVLASMFIFKGSYESGQINIAPPPTIEQAYSESLSYASERFETTELVSFHVQYDDTDAMKSGKPSGWHLTFQNTPGLLPRPNETMEFYINHNSIGSYHNTYEIIRPAYNATLVTNPSEILAILKSENEAISDLDIESITITPVDFSLLKIHNSEECLVDIECAQESIRYIVNIKDHSARLE